MRRWLLPAIALIAACLLASFMIGCVEKPASPIVYTPKLTIYVHQGKLMIYIRPSMGTFLLYREIWVKIGNETIVNETNVPGIFVTENVSYGMLNLTVYVKYVEESGKVHIYEKTYTLEITKRGILVNKIFYGKEYTKFLPEVKTNAWKI